MLFNLLIVILVQVHSDETAIHQPETKCSNVRQWTYELSCRYEVSINGKALIGLYIGYSGFLYIIVVDMKF